MSQLSGAIADIDGYYAREGNFKRRGRVLIAEFNTDGTATCVGVEELFGELQVDTTVPSWERGRIKIIPVGALRMRDAPQEVEEMIPDGPRLH